MSFTKTKEQVKQEKHFIRDDSLSLRHRKWGRSCAVVDLDAIEANKHGEPVALFEYKHQNTKLWPEDFSNFNFSVLISVANRAKLPFFCTKYAEDFTWFKVKPLNEKARKIMATTETFSEQEYVVFLYELRGEKASEEVLEKLNDNFCAEMSFND